MENRVSVCGSSYELKVHGAMCIDLMRLVDRIDMIFPEIEAARPGGSSGLNALVLLNNTMEEARLLIQRCSESSKLYLAMTGDKILSRCKNSKGLLEQSLSQIKNSVPVMLSAEICQIIDDLERVTFSLDPTEEEAGKCVKAVLQQYKFATNSVGKSAIEGIRVAALKLQITSQKALLIERRSIKKLLDKIDDGDHRKQQILTFLLNLLTKYGKSIIREQHENDFTLHEHEDSSSFTPSYIRSIQMESHMEYGHQKTEIPPEEFKCSISLKLMYDPVVIASGQTFERMWIQKWFDEGHDTCPKTNMKLDHISLTPNTGMRDLISKWCMAHGLTIPDPRVQLTKVQSWETSSTSIDSLSMSMNSLHLPVDFSNMSFGSLNNSQSSVSSHFNGADDKTDESDRFRSRSDKLESDTQILRDLDSLSWESQCNAVEEAKNHLKWDDQNFVEPLIGFLKKADELGDVKAQRIGCLLLLEFVSRCRTLPDLNEGAYSLLTSFLNSEVIKEALAIIEVLSGHDYCRSKIAASGTLTSILTILETEVREFQGSTIKILYNLTLNSKLHSLVAPSEFLPRLIPIFEDVNLARYCLGILRNLCDKADARVFIAETSGLISFISNLLENENCEEQEHALAILLSLCSQSVQYCRLVMDEGVIPAVVSISINGNDKGKAYAMELLRLLKDVEYDDQNVVQESTVSDLDFSRDPPSNHDFSRDQTSNYPKARKSSSRIFSMFSRSSLAPKRKV